MKMSKEDIAISNYMEAELYNKTLQIEQRIAEGKTTKTEKLKYKNIFRTEVRVRNGKLNSNKQKKNSTWGGKPKILQTYYNKESTTEIYNSYIPKLFGTNDFYRIDIALDKIKKSTQFNDKMKHKLCKLLETINRSDYTTAKEVWIHKYCSSTFIKHIKLIESIGINAITFNMVIDGVKVEREFIKNFTSLNNSIPEPSPITFEDTSDSFYYK